MNKYLLALATATLLSTSLGYSMSYKTRALERSAREFKEVYTKGCKVFNNSSSSYEEKRRVIMELCQTIKQPNIQMHPIVALMVILKTSLFKNDDMVYFLYTMPLFQRQIALCSSNI